MVMSQHHNSNPAVTNDFIMQLSLGATFTDCTFKFWFVPSQSGSFTVVLLCFCNKPVL